MTPRPNVFLSEGVEQALWVLSPSGRPEGPASFPAKIDPRGIKGSTIHEWFVRCVQDLLDGNEETCLLEDNLAVLALIDWRGNRLTYANIQVLRTDSTISEFCQDAAIRADYLRLDLDFSALGEAFTHPLPHIHDKMDGAPRFLFDPASRNVVADFFDFIYRQFFHDTWLEWARRVWEADYERSVISLADIENDPFNAVMAAFKASQYDVLREHHADVQKLKQVLRAYKDREDGFPLRLEDLASELMAYQHC